MPALQTLVITDRQSTPVNYTLSPDGEGAGKGVYTVSAADASGISISKKKVSLSRRKSSTGRVRTTVKFHAPIMVNETVNGVVKPAVAKENFFDGTFNIDPNCTTAERNDFVGMVASMFLATKPLIHDTIVGDQDVY